MKIYFLSEKPCILTVDGIFYGKTDGFERFTELSLCDSRFISFTPENALPLSFFLNERIFLAPPTGCEVYRFPDGIAVYAREFPSLNNTLTVVAQRRFEDILVTVFAQGAHTLALNTPQGLFTAPLPSAFAECTIEYHQNTVLLQGRDEFLAFDARANLLFREKLCHSRMENGRLYAERIICGRLQACVYEVSEQVFRLVEQNETAPPPDSPLRFFQELICGGDYARMLSGELWGSAEKLREFLGDIHAVVPTDNPERFLLFTRTRERVFEGAYALVSVENGKIADIRIE